MLGVGWLGSWREYPFPLSCSQWLSLRTFLRRWLSRPPRTSRSTDHSYTFRSHKMCRIISFGMFFKMRWNLKPSGRRIWRIGEQLLVVRNTWQQSRHTSTVETRSLALCVAKNVLLQSSSRITTPTHIQLHKDSFAYAPAVAEHLNGTFSGPTTSNMTILMAMTWSTLSVQNARGISLRRLTWIITRHLEPVLIAGRSSDAREYWVAETTTADSWRRREEGYWVRNPIIVDSWYRTGQLVLLYYICLLIRNSIARNLAP